MVLLAPQVFAQTTEPVKVEVSTEKANINGVIYYVHKVQAHQTVYSICKAYGVSTEELLKANSSLKDGLKAGNILFIPVVEKKDQADKVSTEKTNEQLRAEDRTVAPDETQYRTHRVRWYESLRSIAKKYKVSEESIVILNGLTDTELHSRQILKIPNEGEQIVAEQKKEEITQPDEEEISNIVVEQYEHKKISAKEATAKINHLKTIKHFTEDNPATVTLILPFNSQSSNPSDNYFDFYSGALMAINELKERGLSINLNTIDLSSYSWKGEILENELLKKSNLVIGPVDPQDIPLFSEYCKSHRIPFVSPLDHKADTLGIDNPYFFHVPASQLVQMSNLVNNIQHGHSDQVTIFYGSDSADRAYLQSIKALLDNNGIKYNAISYKITRGRVITDSLKRVMKRNVTHEVIVASEDEAFASDVVRNMQLLHLAKIPVRLYGSNKIRSFETIDTKFLYDLNLHISAPYYVDYSSAEAKRFVLQYRSLFHTEPSQFAFQGYDIFKYFLSALKDMGNDFMEYISFYPMNMIQCDFKFDRMSENGGYSNRATKDIEYIPEKYTISVQ